MSTPLLTMRVYIATVKLLEISSNQPLILALFWVFSSWPPTQMKKAKRRCFAYPKACVFWVFSVFLHQSSQHNWDLHFNFSCHYFGANHLGLRQLLHFDYWVRYRGVALWWQVQANRYHNSKRYVVLIGGCRAFGEIIIGALYFWFNYWSNYVIIILLIPNVGLFLFGLFFLV